MVSRKEPYLFLQVGPAERKGIRNDGKSDEIVVRDQFRCRKCRQGIKQQLATPFELSDREQVKASVNLESITTVPITTLLDESSSSEV